MSDRDDNEQSPAKERGARATRRVMVCLDIAVQALGDIAGANDQDVTVNELRRIARRAIDRMADALKHD